MNHRSSLWLLILLVVNGVWLGSAQVPFPGKCPDVKIVDPFDVEAYLGVWYEYAKYPFSFEIGRKCISATYGLIDESTVSVLNAGIYQLLCLLILLVVNGIWLGNAQIPFPGKCPDVKVVDTFDVEAYMGVWYEYSKYPFAFEIGKKCIYANYGVIDNSTVSVLNAAINQLTGNPSNVTGKAKLIAPGQLAVAFYPGQIVWILTREREPSTETIDAAKKILDDNEISQAFLIDTTQKNCPELEGNGTELAGSDELDVDHFVTTVRLNLVLLDLQFSLAMRAFHGPCPSNMTSVSDLDMDRFRGKWYTHSLYPPLSLRIAKCQSTEFLEDTADKFYVVARELNWAVIQTRKRLPPTDIIYLAQHYAHNAGIVISDMSKVAQESCPEDT
ncbi:hypothetical protein M5D96_003861 [Drosophila gunungcola]|uniref:Lipocalin/cytosolic fatty-acid binding domain-containing protein n=1 Tax=Drosophila gunungcola TaxID=103775 RepID=A0A9P9YTM7_9MUSC|nr:hypothetical protein M5D96_003861 [Drosophila gunungcola]